MADFQHVFMIPYPIRKTCCAPVLAANGLASRGASHCSAGHLVVGSRLPFPLPAPYSRQRRGLQYAALVANEQGTFIFGGNFHNASAPSRAIPERLRGQ